jgi:hypothetical protein
MSFSSLPAGVLTLGALIVMPWVAHRAPHETATVASHTTAIAHDSVTSPAAVTTATTAAATASTAAADSVIPVPFKLGEKAVYDVKYSAIHVGTGSMEVASIDNVRGHSAWHTVFQIQGGTFFFHVNDVFESWIDRASFSSLRFYQTQQEGSNDRKKRYEIYPDKKTYTEMDKNPPRDHESVDGPLDDGSFLFYVRTLDLSVGKTYDSNRYFRPERNPVRIRVLRRETIEVPAGKFDCVVVQPVIKTKGIFSENGQAEVWFTDDARHLVVQLKSKLSFGSINLYLKSYTPGK